MKNKLLTVVIFVFLLTVLSGCGTSTKSSSGTNTATGNNPNSSANNTDNTTSQNNLLEKNISTSGSVAENGKLIVFVTNNNSVSLDMEIEVEYYDKNGVIVGSDRNSFTAIGANAEIATEMYDTPSNWDNYKIYVDVEKTNKISYFDKLSINHSNNGEKLAVQVMNNSNNQIDYISVSVVYYQGDKAVGIESDTEYDIKPGRSANYNIYYARDKSYNIIKFDSYKIFITEAYSYNW